MIRSDQQTQQSNLTMSCWNTLISVTRSIRTISAVTPLLRTRCTGSCGVNALLIVGARCMEVRAARHKDVALCCIGPLVFCLSFRVRCTREFEDVALEDWTNNKKWFDIKLLADTCGDSQTPMVNGSHGKHIWKVFNALSIICDKLLHSGRNLGGKTLELLETVQEEIRAMSHWNPSVFDQACLSELPMGPICKLAGFRSNNGFCFNTRTVVAVPA